MAKRRASNPNRVTRAGQAARTARGAATARFRARFSGQSNG